MGPTKPEGLTGRVPPLTPQCERALRSKQAFFEVPFSPGVLVEKVLDQLILGRHGPSVEGRSCLCNLDGELLKRHRSPLS